MTEKEKVISIIGQEQVDRFINEDEISDDFYEKLFVEYYIDHEDMPYGTKKARDGDPYAWIYERLLVIFSDSVV